VSRISLFYSFSIWLSSFKSYYSDGYFETILCDDIFWIIFLSSTCLGSNIFKTVIGISCCKGDSFKATIGFPNFWGTSKSINGFFYSYFFAGDSVNSELLPKGDYIVVS